MNEENKPAAENQEEQKVTYKDLNRKEKIVYWLYIGYKTIFNWKSIIGIVLICIYFSSSNEHSSIGSEDAYQGGRALYLFGGCILIGIGAGTRIKKMLS